MSTDTRILLADDHALVRRGVRLILDDSPGLCVVAEASDGAEAVTLARAEDVDLAILDVAMPRLTGLQAAREIANREPHPRMLMLSMYDNEQYFFEALKAGASPTRTSWRRATPRCAGSRFSTPVSSVLSLAVTWTGSAAAKRCRQPS
jgi:CheY-like chemotaxis protein